VTVGVTHVHLANIPRHIGRRPGDVKTLLETVLMDGVDIVDPDRHPHPLVSSLLAFRPEGLPERAPAPAAMSAITHGRS